MAQVCVQFFRRNSADHIVLVVEARAEATVTVALLAVPVGQHASKDNEGDQC